MMSNGIAPVMPQMSQPANATSEKSKMQPQAEREIVLGNEDRTLEVAPT